MDISGIAISSFSQCMSDSTSSSVDSMNTWTLETLPMLQVCTTAWSYGRHLGLAFQVSFLGVDGYS